MTNFDTGTVTRYVADATKLYEVPTENKLSERMVNLMGAKSNRINVFPVLIPIIPLIISFVIFPIVDGLFFGLILFIVGAVVAFLYGARVEATTYSRISKQYPSFRARFNQNKEDLFGWAQRRYNVQLRGVPQAEAVANGLYTSMNSVFVVDGVQYRFTRVNESLIRLDLAREPSKEAPLSKRTLALLKGEQVAV